MILTQPCSCSLRSLRAELCGLGVEGRATFNPQIHPDKWDKVTLKPLSSNGYPAGNSVRKAYFL